MNKLLLIFFASATLSAQAQICDSLVPTFYIDFTGAAAGTTWTSPPVARAGYCCTASGFDRCIDFIFTVDSNTSAVILNYYSGGPQGAIFYQVDCDPPVPIEDSTQINTCGVHCLTMCKPGNSYGLYWVTSILAASPAPCIGYTQCDTMIPTNLNDFQVERSSEIFPNPFHTTSVLKISDSRFAHCNLYIYDRMGQLLRKEIINNQTTLINRGSLAAGIYFYQLLFDDRHQTTGKFVIE